MFPREAHSRPSLLRVDDYKHLSPPIMVGKLEIHLVQCLAVFTSHSFLVRRMPEETKELRLLLQLNDDGSVAYLRRFDQTPARVRLQPV